MKKSLLFYIIISLFIISSCSPSISINSTKTTETAIPLDEYRIFSDEYLDINLYVPIKWDYGKRSLKELAKYDIGQQFFYSEDVNPEGFIYGFYPKNPNEYKQIMILSGPSSNEVNKNYLINWMDIVEKTLSEKGAQLIEKKIYENNKMPMAVIKFIGKDSLGTDIFSVMWYFQSLRNNYFIQLTSKVVDKKEIIEHFQVMFQTLKMDN